MDHCSHIIISKIRKKLSILKIQFYQNKHRASWEKFKHMKSCETDSSDTKLSVGIRVQSSDLKAHAPEFSSYKYLWRRARLLLWWSSWFLQQVVCGDSNCDSQCSQASFILFSIKNIQNTCYFGVCLWVRITVISDYNEILRTLKWFMIFQLAFHTPNIGATEGEPCFSDFPCILVTWES